MIQRPCGSGEQHVAVRRGDQRAAIARQVAAHVYVTDQRGAGIGLALEDRAHRLAGDAGRAAGTDDPVGLDDLARAVGSLHGDEHRVVPRLDRGHGHAVFDGHAEREQVVGENLLGAVLRQAGLKSPAAAGIRKRQFAHDPQVGIKHSRVREGVEATSTSSRMPTSARISSVPGCSAVARA